MSACVCGPIRHMLGNQHDSRCPLYPAPFVPPMTVTVVDHIPYSASVSIVMVPAEALSDGYSRRMAELCSALVALGCAERPSEILKGMGEERLGG